MFQRNIEEGFTMVSKISILEVSLVPKTYTQEVTFQRIIVDAHICSKEVSKTVLKVLKTYIKEGSVGLMKVSNRIL